MKYSENNPYPMGRLADVWEFMNAANQMDTEHFEGEVTPFAQQTGVQLKAVADLIKVKVPGVRGLRARLIVEEVGELVEAIGKGDEAETLDALVDLVYVTLGAAIALDLPFREAWAEVQAANMRKFRCHVCKGNGCDECEDGYRVYTDGNGKAVKPPDWVGPDLQPIMEAARS